MTSSPPLLDAATDRLRAEIALLRDRLAASSRALDDRSLATLIAATPQADHEYRIARDGHLSLLRQLEQAQSAMGSLILEREGLRAG